MKILIAGAPKSGTTALFYKIRRSLAADEVREMFEPLSYKGSEADAKQSVLAKTLIYGGGDVDFASFDGFDKKIGLVRDPRDLLVSSLLYGIYDAPFCEDDAATSQVVALLQRKEADPKSVGLLDLVRLYRSLGVPPGTVEREGNPERYVSELLKSGSLEEFFGSHLKILWEFFRLHPEYHIVIYEKFVSGDVEALEQYLGLALKDNNTVGTEYTRVIRTKGSGDWRNWFIEKDVDFFRPLFAPYMEHFGYADDWSLPAAPSISPDHGSGYVRGLIADRRAGLKTSALMEDPAKTRELLDRTRKTFKAFHSRYVLDLEANREKLAGEMVDLEAAVGYLAHEIRVVAQLSRELDVTKGKLEKTSAKLEETKAKLQQIRDEQERLQKSFLWKITRPFRRRAA